MPSEAIAKDMLRDVLLNVDNKGKGLIVTTFSSQIARLKSIMEIGKQLKRKVIFLGRSIAKYTQAAENANVAFFSKEVHICKYGDHVRKLLAKVQKEGKQKYMLVVTGHQGEPKALLSRMANGELPFKFTPDDHIIFSCTTIPSEINIKQRTALEAKLRSFGVRMFKDIHVSGHCAKEDLRDTITMLQPKIIIPAHGEKKMTDAFEILGKEMGYHKGKTLFVMQEGERLTIK